MKPKKKNQARLAALLFTLICATVLSVACAPGTAENDDASDNASVGEASVDFTWSESSDCGTCHTTALESYDDPACIAFKHAELKGECLTCHADIAALEQVHAKVDLDSVKLNSRLKKTEVPESVCTPCHNKEELALATESSTVLTDDIGRTANPHQLPEHEQHSKLICTSCHKEHSEVPSAEVASDQCTNCHHNNLYECHTCHEDRTIG